MITISYAWYERSGDEFVLKNTETGLLQGRVLRIKDKALNLFIAWQACIFFSDGEAHFLGCFNGCSEAQKSVENYTISC